nr:unnamed protein product [Haemonchus contortus]
MVVFLNGYRLLYQTTWLFYELSTCTELSPTHRSESSCSAAAPVTVYLCKKTEMVCNSWYISYTNLVQRTLQIGASVKRIRAEVGTKYGGNIGGDSYASQDFEDTRGIPQAPSSPTHVHGRHRRRTCRDGASAAIHRHSDERQTAKPNAKIHPL